MIEKNKQIRPRLPFERAKASAASEKPANPKMHEIKTSSSGPGLSANALYPTKHSSTPTAISINTQISDAKAS
jgi:hypothetical protein